MITAWPPYIMTIGLLAQCFLLAQEPTEKPEAAYRISLLANAPQRPGKPYEVPRGFANKGWKESGKYNALLGPSFWTEEENAVATFNPDLERGGNWRVSIFKVVTGTAADDPAAPFRVYHENKVEELRVDLTGTQPQWLILGTWFFSATADEYLEIKPGKQAGKMIRLGEIKFERMGPGEQVLETVVVDLHRILLRPPFADMQAGPFCGELTSLWRKQISLPATPTQFDNRDGISCGETWLLAMRCLGQTNGADGLKMARELGIFDKRSQALSTLNPNKKITAGEGADIFAAVSEYEGKGHRADTILAFLPGPHPREKILSRTAAHLLARRYLHRVRYPGPRGGSTQGKAWKIVFEDHFSGATLDAENWVSQNGPSHHIASSRWPENAKVSNDQLHLIQKKESRGGQEWTSGSVWTKKQWLYGYMECSYRYAAAAGINQSFWMFSNPRDPRVELDPNEGKYPDVIEPHYILHPKGTDWVGQGPRPRVYGSKTLTIGENLAEDFHIYGMYWDAQELIFYFDGREIHRIPNEGAHAPVSVYFSTAVFPGPDGHGNPLADGTSMDVEWVRVWQP